VGDPESELGHWFFGTNKIEQNKNFVQLRGGAKGFFRKKPLFLCFSVLYEYPYSFRGFH
jgi:hypothetical protein